MKHDYSVVDNPSMKRYEMHIDDQVARIEYITAGNRIYLTHTEVPAGLSGRGIGNLMIGKALDDVKAKGLELVPLCPFVAAYIKKYPEWKSILHSGTRVD